MSKSRAPRRPTAIEVAPAGLDEVRAEVAAAVAASSAPAVEIGETSVVETTQVAEAVANDTTDAVTTIVDQAVETAVSATEQVATTTQEQAPMATDFNTAQAAMNEMKDGAQNAMQKAGRVGADMAEFGKGNVEALAESTRIAAKGAEQIFQYSADYARQTVEKGNETARRFAAVRSPVEFFQLQGEVTKGFVDAFVSEGAKFTENYLKLVSETMQPLSNRAAVAVEKVRQAA